MKQITLADANDFVVSAALDGTAYKLHFAYNSQGWWTVDLRDMDNTELVRGVRVIPNFPLLASHRRVKGLPPGELMAVSVNDGGMPGRQDFLNGKYMLFYVPEEEMNAVLQADL